MKNFFGSLIVTGALAVGIVSCGSDSGSDSGSNNGGNYDDIIKGCQNNDGYYVDSGFTNGVRLKPGQMPSDVNTVGITACAEGGFVYNGKCWDSLSYDADNYRLTAQSGTGSAVLLDMGQNFDTERNKQVENIQNGSKSCEFLSTSGSCTTYFDYRDPRATRYYSSTYNPTPHQSFSWNRNISTSVLSYNGGGTPYSLDEYIYLRTDFGACGIQNGSYDYQKSLYRWFYNGSIVMNGATYSNPINLEKLRAIYGNNLKYSSTTNECLFYGGCYYYENSTATTIFGFSEGVNATNESNLNLIIVQN